MIINLPENVAYIIDKLEEAGFEAYAVGGCVRDVILGRTPNDWDITTSATPEQTKALFKKTFDTGIQHGTVSVLLNREIYEVTTYRIDGKYEDSRHPKEVTFTVNLEDDLLRRDFTINAMAYNPRRGLVDVYGGIKDIESRTIRCVGNAKERFSEDALRILRAIRFAAQLGYEIEEETEAAIKELAPTLANISAERIQVELIKTITSDNPSILYKAYELGVTKVFLPELDRMLETEQNNPHHMYTVGRHSLVVCENIPATKGLRLAALLHDVAKPIAKTTDEQGVDHFNNHPQMGAKLSKEILRRLKMDNDTINYVSRLVEFHDYRPEISKKAIRRFVNKMGEEYFPDIFTLQRADLMGQSSYKKEEKLSRLDAIEKLYDEIRKDNECLSLKTLAVKGKDLIDAGVNPGPDLGLILGKMLECVLENPENNDKEYLINHFVKNAD